MASPAWLFAATLGWAVACHGAASQVEQPGSARFDSTLPDDSELGSFSAEESSRFCNERADWELLQAQAHLPALCRQQGLSAAQLCQDPSKSLSELKRACQDAYDRCMTGQTLIRRDCSEQAFGAACHATVAEAEACSAELLEDGEQENETVPECSDLVASDIEAAPAAIGLRAFGPACSNVMAKCPGADPS
jgi:hypothetical protein